MSEGSLKVIDRSLKGIDRCLKLSEGSLKVIERCLKVSVRSHNIKDLRGLRRQRRRWATLLSRRRSRSMS